MDGKKLRNGKHLVNKFEWAQKKLEDSDSLLGGITIDRDENTVLIRGIRSIKINDGNFTTADRIRIYPEAEMMVFSRALGGCDQPINLLQLPINELWIETHHYEEDLKFVKIV